MSSNDHFDLWTWRVPAGVVQCVAPLDYETARSHNLTVRARDPISGSHTDAHLTVTVTDVNDNPPQFSSHVFKGSVSEAAAPGHQVLQVSLQNLKST